MKRSKRFVEVYDQAEVIKDDVFLKEMPEAGLICWNSPNDPKASLVIENGVVVEMDSKRKEDFDLLDRFIAAHSIDLLVAEEAMKIDSLEFAKMLVDINVPRREIIRLARGMTPAKWVEIITKLNMVEMMQAGQKMRARLKPANQCGLCNHKDDFALLMADSASAAAIGFVEQEATVGWVQDAPSVALGILIGSQIGCPGTLTQCAVEEATELSLGMKGFTSYAETVSVYGTEKVFIDGDDLPWSKAFLASAYASRGLKLRFTSGTGSEVVMGGAEGKSLLYLEARCIALTLGSGVQGTQNGGVSCSPVAYSLPGGQACITGESLLCMMVGLEVASGNDGPKGGAEGRRWTQVLPWLVTGSDFCHSGFGYTSIWDNMFSGACFNQEDLETEMAIQRDFMCDCGLKSITEDQFIKIRKKAVQVAKDLCEEFNWPEYTDEELENTVYCNDSDDINRRQSDNIKMNKMIVEEGITLIDIIKALYRKGHTELANTLTEMAKRRLAGDYLHTSAIFDKDFNILSGVNTPNEYTGPGTGYRLEGTERWEEIKALRNVLTPESFVKMQKELDVAE